MDLCEKKRSSQGANYRREDLLGKKEERRRAKVKKDRSDHGGSKSLARLHSPSSLASPSLSP